MRIIRTLTEFVMDQDLEAGGIADPKPHKNPGNMIPITGLKLFKSHLYIKPVVPLCELIKNLKRSGGHNPMEQIERYRGCLLGLAVGDDHGTTL